MTPTHDRPCAAHGLVSYRAKGCYGWIMIGAMNEAHAMNEARRSTPEPTDLQVWDGSNGCYLPVGGDA